MTTDPGAPRTDELARNAARNALAEAIRRVGYNFYGAGPEGDPDVVAEHLTNDHTVTWETDVSSAGAPVRRYVLRGAWEVDLNPPAAPASPADGVEWHRHTHDMWVGEGYGAKVLVEVDGLATSRREKWRARTFTNGEGSKTISDAPLTLAKAKHDGVKYLWSRRGESVTPSPAAAYAAEAMMVRPDARPHCEVTDGPCPGNQDGVICGKPCEEDQAVPTRIV